jgi:hypothetical protein
VLRFLYERIDQVQEGDKACHPPVGCLPKCSDPCGLVLGLGAVQMCSAMQSVIYTLYFCGFIKLASA